MTHADFLTTVRHDIATLPALDRILCEQHYLYLLDWLETAGLSGKLAFARLASEIGALADAQRAHDEEAT